MLSWRYFKRVLAYVIFSACAVFIIVSLLPTSSNSSPSIPIHKQSVVNPKHKADTAPVQILELNGFHVYIYGSDNGEGDRSVDSGTVKGASEKEATFVDTKEKACKIPKLEMNGVEVAHFFKPSQPIECKSKENWAFIDDRGLFALIPTRSSAKCKVSSIVRLNDNKVIYSPFVSINVGSKLPSDFVKVACDNSAGEGDSVVNVKWTGLLMSAIPDEKVISRVKETKTPEDWSGLDVYFIGLDSVSQMTYRRKMPKTVKYLESVMDAVVLDGYNIVGDGTPQAFIPILTGSTEEELPLTRKRFKNASYVDDVYPFIWKNFSNAGYVTGYGEDAAAIGTFTYRLKGFHEQPTDHLTRTFFHAYEALSNRFCLGSEPLFESWFRYAKEFMQVYSSIPRFLLMHLSLYSHDDINQVGSLDDGVSSHLQYMHESGLLNKSLVIFMADHGHRFAQLRSTHQGQLEERLPFFSFALPKTFREGKMKKAWENMVKNKEMLTTPFDIHATLMDILHQPTEEQLQKIQDPSHRSLSLFRPIPMSRTCEQAGVEAHWCTCLNWEDAMAGKEEDKSLVNSMAHAVVSSFNAQTEPERVLCAPLQLKNLIYAKRMVPNEALLKYKNVKDADGFVPDLSGTTKVDLVFYQLKLETTPGRAVYEITLRHEVSENKLHIDLSSVSHVNRFGDDPHCIIDKNYFLATYCLCYDKIEK